MRAVWAIVESISDSFRLYVGDQNICKRGGKEGTSGTVDMSAGILSCLGVVHCSQVHQQSGSSAGYDTPEKSPLIVPYVIIGIVRARLQRRD